MITQFVFTLTYKESAAYTLFMKPLRLTATSPRVKIHLPEFLFPRPDSSYYIAVLMDVNGAEIPRRYALSG